MFEYLLPANAHAAGVEPGVSSASAHAQCWHWCVQAGDGDDAAAVVLSLLSPEVPAPAAAGASPSVLELPVDLAGAAAPPCAPMLLPGTPMPSCVVVARP